MYSFIDTACLFDSWSNESCKVRNTVMYGYIMTMLLFFFYYYFVTACLFDSWSDGSHKVCAIVMYGYIRYCAQKTLNFVVNGS